jgi:hypothetical protein
MRRVFAVLSLLFADPAPSERHCIHDGRKPGAGDFAVSTPVISLLDVSDDFTIADTALLLNIRHQFFGELTFVDLATELD